MGLKKTLRETQGLTQRKPVSTDRGAGKNAFALLDNRPFSIADKNNTGLPDQLKSGIESLSGYSMDGVKVYYNSSKPAQLNAYAYAQGTDIHLGAGQEKHLPHEAWHVVQQMQGRVKPTMKLGKANINDDQHLENEATLQGDRALQYPNRTGKSTVSPLIGKSANLRNGILQRAPFPQLGPPETLGLYNAQAGSKGVIWDGKKPSFGTNLYMARLHQFAGASEGSITTKSGHGTIAVAREMVQLDHDPSWRDRVQLIEIFPRGKTDEQMEPWVSKGYYIKEKGIFRPTVYCMRMYYNDYNTLSPATGGHNASGGADAAAHLGHMGDFKQELLKDHAVRTFGNISLAFADGLNIEDGGNPDHILQNIDATMDKLAHLKDQIAAMAAAQKPGPDVPPGAAGYHRGSGSHGIAVEEDG